jgi:multidrug efflux pump subunit AcrA (membrane-fusion protein)
MQSLSRPSRFFSDQSAVPKCSSVVSWFLVSIVFNAGYSGVAKAQQGPASVVVADVLRFDVSARQSFVGNVVANRRVIVGSAVDGRVLDSPIKAGQPIATRDTLALVRTVTIEIEIEAAKAELELRVAELEELQNGSRPEEIQLAEASLEAAGALRDYAKTKFSRAERLIASGSGISQDEFEEARSEYLRAVAMVAEASSQLELVRQGPRPEKIRQAAARVEVQKQVIAGLEDRLDKYTVRAPFDGFVITEMTQAGAWLTQGQAVAEIVEIDPIEIELFVPESNIGFVRKGLQVVVRVDALPGRDFPGEVVQIVPFADPRARTFPVKVRVPNPAEEAGHPLLPGMLAQVRLPTSLARESLMVPKDALQLGGEQPVVMKVADGKAVSVAVVVGPSLGNLIAVEPAGDAVLDEGDLVVVRGNERLRNDQAVVIASQISIAPPPAYNSR